MVWVLSMPYVGRKEGRKELPVFTDSSTVTVLQSQSLPGSQSRKKETSSRLIMAVFLH